MANTRPTDESFIGSFTSETELTTRYPAVTSSGRQASVTIGGYEAPYVCDGSAWRPLASYATDTSGNVTGLVGPGGVIIPTGVGYDTAVLLIGGDHPYKQWWGTNGSDGMAAAYLDRGIKPYLAICSDTPGMSPGTGVDTLSWAEVKALQSKGVEIDSHGAWHWQDWSRANTGVTFAYSGVAAAPTVQITNSGVVLVGNGGAENTTVTFAGAPTLAQLATAVSAVPSWSLTVRSELKGTEASSNLLVTPARNIKSVSGAGNFCAGGGLTIITTGTGHTHSYVWINGNYFDIFVDGVRKYRFDMTSAPYDTVAELAAAVTASAATDGYACYEADTSVAGTNQIYRFQKGDELSINLKRGIYPLVRNGYMPIDAGLPHRYMIERNAARVIEVAANYGVTIEHFQNSGDAYYPHLHRGIRSVKSFRATRNIKGVWPSQWPTWASRNWIQVKQFDGNTGGYNRASSIAAIDALSDSPGYAVNALIHRILPDGSSGYQFVTNGDFYYDQLEADFIAELDRIKALVAAGRLVTMTPGEFRARRKSAVIPENLLFNPALVTNGANQFNKVVSEGLETPGWSINTPNSVFSAFAIAAGEVSASTTATTSTDFIYQDVHLERGKTYEFGFELETSNVSSGNGIYPFFGRARNRFAEYMRGSGMGETGSATAMGGTRSLGQSTGGNNSLTTHSVFITVPVAGEPRKPLIVSKAGPFNLISTPAQVALNVFNLGSLTINLAGATPTATTAEEVAAAINAAITASALYPVEFRSMAKVVNNKVVISAPYVPTISDPLSSTTSMQIAAGGTNDASTTVFGGLGYTAGSLYEDMDADSSGIYRVGLNVSIVGSWKVRNLYLQDLSWI